MTQSNTFITLLDFPLQASAVQAVEVVGEDYLSSPFYFLMTLHINDEADIELKKLIQQPVTFQLGYPNETPKTVNGLIYQAKRLTNALAAGKILEIQIRPQLQWLNDNTDSRVYATDKPMSLIDIVESVFKRNGLTSYQLKLTKTYPPVERCVQYNESDLNFVSRLLEQSGVYYYFVHSPDAHVLVLEDAPTPSFGKSQTALYSEDTHSQAPVHQWQLSAQPNITSVTAQRYDFTQPEHLLTATTHTATEQSGLPAGFFAKHFLYNTIPVASTQALLEQITHTALTCDITRKVNATGKSGYPQWQAGTTFRFKQPASTTQHGAFYIIAIRHHAIERPPLIQGEPQHEAQHYENSFVAYQADHAFTPLAKFSSDTHTLDENSSPTALGTFTAKQPCITGLLLATVTGPKETAIYTDKYGRVKLQFDWDNYSQNNENSFAWVRVKQTWASDKFGLYVTPRVGDKVLVSFQGGDPNQPIVIGALNDDSHDLPFSSTPEKSGFRSHSLKNQPLNNSCEGNALIFNDCAQAASLEFEAYKDMNITTPNNKTLAVNDNTTVTVENGNVVQTVGGNITITASSSISLINGNSQIKITDSDITIQANKLFFDGPVGSATAATPTSQPDSTTAPNAVMQSTVTQGQSSHQAVSQPAEQPFPGVSLELSLIPALEGIVVYEGKKYLYKAQLSGSVLLKKVGTYSPVNFSLNDYKLQARATLGNFFADLKIYPNSHEYMVLGSKITGDFVSSSLQFYGKIIKFTATPQSLEKTFSGWNIGGDLAYTMDLISDNQPPVGMAAENLSAWLQKEWHNIKTASLISGAIIIGRSLAPIIAQLAVDLLAAA